MNAERIDAMHIIGILASNQRRVSIKTENHIGRCAGYRKWQTQVRCKQISSDPNDGKTQQTNKNNIYLLINKIAIMLVWVGVLLAALGSGLWALSRSLS